MGVVFGAEPLALKLEGNVDVIGVRARRRPA